MRALAISALMSTLVFFGYQNAEAGFLLDEKEKRLREELVGTGVTIGRNTDGSIDLIMPSQTFSNVSPINTFAIQPQFQSALNHVAQVLFEGNALANLALVIHGHTDNTGSATVNKAISENRANAVLNYLVSQNIDDFRMISRGYGATSPIAENTTALGREQNRRVEISIYATNE